jgi:hypothetical protein
MISRLPIVLLSVTFTEPKLEMRVMVAGVPLERVLKKD